MFVIIYQWVTYGSQPHIALWIILAGLSLIPLAERLKIGNWFEFTKKIGKLDREVTSTQEELDKVSNRLETFMTATQIQQQISLSAPSPEAARAFAEGLASTRSSQYSSISPGISDLVKEKSLVSEEITEVNKQILDFIYNADKTIAALFPLLQAIYSVEIVTAKGKVLTQEEIKEVLRSLADKDIFALVEATKKHFPKSFRFEDSDKKCRELFEPVDELITLRKRLDEDETTLPPVEESKKLIARVQYTIGFLTGMVSEALIVLFAGFPQQSSK